MVMRKKPDATFFMEKLKETENVYSARLDMIKESNMAMDNKYGDELQKMFKTKSRYMSPDPILAKFNMEESLNARIPVFLFGANSKDDVQTQKEIHSTIKKYYTAYSVDSKVIPVISKAFNCGLCVAELYVKEVMDEGWRLPDDWDPKENQAPAPYSESRGWGFDLRVYDVIQNNVRIDPLCSPHNIADTAEYVIIKEGDFSKEGLEELARSKRGVTGWDPDFTKVEMVSPSGTTSLYDFRQYGVEESHGVYKQTLQTYPVHKIYYKDGTIDWILNNEYIIAKGIINNKLIKGMPLVFFTPFPGAKHPYGLTLWELIKHANNLVSGIANLTADVAVKNINASVITDSQALAQDMDPKDLFDNKIISMEQSDRDIRQRVHQLQLTDMTPALQTLLNLGMRDTQRISRVSSLQQGIQDKQVRSPGVANAMLQSNISAKSMFVRMAEITLYRPLGIHMIKSIYNHFPKFKNDITLDREKFNIVNLRVKNGSTLEEDQASHIQNLLELLTLAMKSPIDWEVRDVAIDYFKEKGLPEIETYISQPQKAIMKNLLALNIPQNMAVEIMGGVQAAAQQTGGQEAQQGDGEMNAGQG